MGLGLSKSLLFAVLITISAVAQAGPMTFGPEWELTSADLQEAPEFHGGPAPNCPEKQAQMLFVEKIRERCQKLDCTVTGKPGKWDTDFTVQFTDGWWFKVSYDPAVVEITAKPSTLEELTAREALLDDAIFATGAELGLKPKADSSAHVNFGVNSAFDGDPELFLRFFVDYANHPDLTMGSLGYDDPENSPPLALLKQQQRDALQEIIREFYTGQFKTVAALARAIQDRVYTSSYNPDWGGATHYQAIGLKTVNRTDLTKQDAPEELRSVFSQLSVEQFVLVGRLLEGRINYLKTVKTPIVYTGTTRADFTASDLKNRFYIYVTEAGMNYADYKSLLPLSVQKAALSPFLTDNASIMARLKDLENFTDLFDASPWIKERARQTIASAQAVKNPTALEIVARVKALITKGCEALLMGSAMRAGLAH